MLKVLVSRAGHDMAAVCLLRPMCSWGYYRPVPVSVCTKLVASSRFLPWVCVNFSSKGLAAGVRIAESATRKAPARPLRLRIAKAAIVNETTTDVKHSEGTLRKGVLLEFSKESGKYVLAVIQRPEGKKNWVAADQFGNVHSVKPQQITFIVPGAEDFKTADISAFINKAQTLEDSSLLEFAWEELLDAKKDVNAVELAKICYGDGPIEYYAAHRLLISQQVYFRCKQKGPSAIYEPRPLSQVNDLKQQQIIEKAAREELLVYINEIRSACDLPHESKPPLNHWQSNAYFNARTDALRVYALELASAPKAPQQRQLAEEVLEALNISKKSSTAVDLLIKMGVFPVHVNLELLKSGVPIEFSSECVEAAQSVMTNPPLDTNLADRVDLTHLKVYTIDSEDADEIDDGLSAIRLPDGRIKVWIHVADPTRWVPPMHLLDKEAKRRSTSIYLPTGAVPMFPMNLASTVMSLRQGHEACALTVSIIFHCDGSIAESEVMCSTIKPTYRLSYDNAAELLSMNVEEEAELYLLAEVAKSRREWRNSQGAIDATVPEASIKVLDPDSPKPSIIMSVVDQAGPASQLVSEMMIACGEALAAFGEEKNISLPYRGQASQEIPAGDMEAIPEGPCRALALRRYLGRADMSFMKPISHAALGVRGYVQFTSPIRRYSDLLAHYQVKAILRGEPPPFSSAYVEAVMAVVNLQSRQARKLQVSSTRYWAIEYLRRQPRGTQFQALVLRFVREGEPLVLIEKLGIQAQANLVRNTAVGSEITVIVEAAYPRNDFIILRQV
ncbi:ribonuclease II, chloroplastic/mitochondrial [Physcomitrium patens]|uniref:RNB domain-containing protein n=1 Tax=Physcomitrium patens TaxID=3218 RepID=A0A2K1JIJ5_PHYPA|nr:ribonuclease II, chloroplastic/mitochondrial-like [Physcomitrium patens]PNR41380.1 hypothetical protein PHYPA_018783 [Physcomitrium patens]|eukprot:XP_024394538.1 ribonuclease II, chloroplastic/mitochondrial-like [Physcomitrella patens]